MQKIQQDSDPKFGLMTSFSFNLSSSTKFNDISDITKGFAIIDNYC